MNIKSDEPTKGRSGFHYQTSRNQFLTIVEEPEIHLNPKIEARMGDFFLDIRKENTGVLIETHSEHIINRIQRRVAEGSVQSDAVTIYFVEKSSGETNVKEIEIDDKGSFDHWPQGFFQEDFDDAIEVLKNNVETEVTK
jgi:predicted ATPase